MSTGVHINRAALLKYACQLPLGALGMELFNGVVGQGDVYIDEWTALHEIWFQHVSPEACGWMHAMKFIPRVNLSGLDVSGFELPRAQFYGFDMTGMKVEKTNFAGADFRRCVLHGTDLSKANIAGANFDGAFYDGELVGWQRDERGQLVQL